MEARLVRSTDLCLGLTGCENTSGCTCCCVVQVGKTSNSRELGIAPEMAVSPVASPVRMGHGSLVGKSIGMVEFTVFPTLGWAASARPAALVASLHLATTFAFASL